MKNQPPLFAAVAPSLKVGNCRHNANIIVEKVKDLAQKGVKVALFPELSITAYTCGDLFFTSTLIEGAKNRLIFIKEACASLDITVIVGLPVLFEGRLFNCAAALKKGKILGFSAKSKRCDDNGLLEGRYFSDGAGIPQGSFVDFCGDSAPIGANLVISEEAPFAIAVGQDIFSIDSSGQLSLTQSVNFIANPWAKAVSAESEDDHICSVAEKSTQFGCPIIYASAGFDESTTDLVFGGRCAIISDRRFVAASLPFEGGLAVGSIGGEAAACPARPKIEEHSPHPFYPSDEKELEKMCRTAFLIQAHGLKKRLSHSGIKDVVLGISGGLDSTLALLVAVKAFALSGLDISGIHGLTLPCFGTTSRTKSNAHDLCRALNVSIKEIDISAAVLQHFADIGHDKSDLSVTFENSQARERTQVVMDYANRVGGLALGTGDLSEIALGWSTYNGDHMSMYSLNCGVPKTFIQPLLRYISAEFALPRLTEVLNDIIATPVSPELLPAKDGDIAQITEDIVGPYLLHDFYLYHFMKNGKTPKEIFALAQKAFAGVYTDQTVLKWMKIFFRRFFGAQFKRSCSPDGPRVFDFSLSPRNGLILPSDCDPSLWIDEIEELELSIK